MHTYTTVLEAKFVFFKSKHLLVLFSDLFFVWLFRELFGLVIITIWMSLCRSSAK